MKKYTLEDFEKFEKDDNDRIICPTGDYTEIKQFPEHCSFGEWCSFGNHCSFGKCCSFGERCNFGEWCSFGECCSFGEWCSFGWCCSFGERCSFGEDCSFDVGCSFGERCNFGERCKVENDKELKRFLKFEGFGSERRCTYFFLLTDNTIYVRCGCFSGYIDEFRSKVKETHGNSLYAQGYFKVADLAQWYFEEENKND